MNMMGNNNANHVIASKLDATEISIDENLLDSMQREFYKNDLTDHIKICYHM